MKESQIQARKANRGQPEPADILQEHLRQKYPIEVVEDEDGVVASIPDLPGCVSFGETIQQAVENLKAIEELWIKGRVESGQPVPEPSRVEDFSGKFVLRIPRGLHRSLDREAKKQGVSLNQYILHLVSERHAVSKLETFVLQASSTLLANQVHGSLSWPEEEIRTQYTIEFASTTAKSAHSPLEMIQYLRKPLKQFSLKQQTSKMCLKAEL
jgi:antitoxin HicB